MNSASAGGHAPAVRGTAGFFASRCALAQNDSITGEGAAT
jgi:hypothetical protein